MSEKSLIPSLLLKEPQRIFAFYRWLVIKVPPEIVRLEMRFLLWLWVAIAWKKLVFSSPRLTHLIVFLYFQFFLLASSKFERCDFTRLQKLDSRMDKGLWSSSPTKRSRTQLLSWTILLRFERLLLQALRPALTCLNLVKRVLAKLANKHCYSNEVLQLFRKSTFSTQ